MSSTVEEWREARMPHFLACQEALGRFFEAQLMRVSRLLEFKRDVFTYSSRIKSAESAAKTAIDTGLDYWKLNDWLGIRLSCPTLEAAYHLSVAINDFDEWIPGVRHDHNIEPQIDGYRGIHVYGEVVYELPADVSGVRVSCEIQLHTRLQSVWAELTHDDVYKPTKTVPIFVHDTAANLAAYMAATDQLFERTLKVLRDPGSQLQPVGMAETRHWISVLAMLEPGFDWYDIEPVIMTLRAQGINTGQQLEMLRSNYMRLKSLIELVWSRERIHAPSSAVQIAMAGRLIAQRVRNQDIERELTDWARAESVKEDAVPEDVTDGE